MAFNFSLQYFYPFNFHIVKKNCITHINLFILFFTKLKKIIILDISKLLLFLNVQYFYDFIYRPINVVIHFHSFRSKFC
jgi:hypothetical protein